MQTRLAHPQALLLVTIACLTACGGGDDDSGVLDCPGVDGTYYYVLTPSGSCAGQGVSLNESGATVSDGTTIDNQIPGCNTTAQYEGCQVTISGSCSGGVAVSAEQTFTPGTPGHATGRIAQTPPSGEACVVDIYGSTDLEEVRQHAAAPTRR